MLAVDVERQDTRGYLGAGVRVWDFAPKIDHLFLFVRDDTGSDGSRLRRLTVGNGAEMWPAYAPCRSG